MNMPEPIRVERAPGDTVQIAHPVNLSNDTVAIVRALAEVATALWAVKGELGELGNLSDLVPAVRLSGERAAELNSVVERLTSHNGRYLSVQVTEP